MKKSSKYTAVPRATPKHNHRLGRTTWDLLDVLLVASIAFSVSATEVPTEKHTVDNSVGGARSVYAADVDGDGDTDLLGAAVHADDIAWWENTSSDGSTWTKHLIDDAFDGAFSVFAADMDGDGDIDALGAATADDDITWWENASGDGSTWTEHTVDSDFAAAHSVHAADVDGDGDTDVLGAALIDDEITWWENTAGDGSAWTEHTVDGDFDGAYSVFVADMDGDGDSDLLGAALFADDITWWENTASDGSAWTEHLIDGDFDSTRTAYAADVDGDGDTEVVGASFTTDLVTWWENIGGDGSVWARHTVGTDFDGCDSVFATDVDGDGDIDVLGTASISDQLTWWENTVGDGSAWTEHTIGSFFDRARSVFATDVDGDGDIDVVGAAEQADEIAWWQNETIHRSAVHPYKHTIDGVFDSARAVHAMDMDGDGDTDVLGAASQSDDIAWWENTSGDGSVWSEHLVDGEFDSARSVHAADVDGDGDSDVLGAAFFADAITWWENTTGDGSAWAEHTVDGAFDGAISVIASDIDGDGDCDVLAAANVADAITWWENTLGDGSAWVEHTVDDAFDGANSVFAADVDGDGDIDVLGAATNADDITWWDNTAGDGTAWAEHTIDGEFDFAHSVYAIDVDGDGDTDVLGAATNAGEIAWWENTAGDGSAWTEHAVDAAFAFAVSVYATDMDGDGDTDVLGASSLSSDVIWWENTAR